MTLGPFITLPCPPGEDLTPRELEVVRLLIDGLTNQEIAAHLTVSPRTVQAHLANAMARTHTRSRTQLAILALRRGLVPLGTLDQGAETADTSSESKSVTSS